MKIGNTCVRDWMIVKMEIKYSTTVNLLRVVHVNAWRDFHD